MYMSYIKKQVDKKVVGLRVKTNMFINLPIKKKTYVWNGIYILCWNIPKVL